jgi:hypothetical protein
MKKIIFAATVALVATSVILCNASKDIFQFSMGGIKGNGQVIKKEINGLSNFEGVGNGISADIILTQGNEYKVVYEGESNLLDYIAFNVKNDALDINNKENNKWIQNTKPIKIYISMPTLKSVALGGSGNVSSTNDFDSDILKIAIGGSGDVAISGRVNELKIAIGGSGDCDLRDLRCQKAKVSIAGSGDCRLNVSDELDVSIAGSGDVRCKGKPRLKETIVGSGSVSLED